MKPKFDIFSDRCVINTICPEMALVILEKLYEAGFPRFHPKTHEQPALHIFMNSFEKMCLTTGSSLTTLRDSSVGPAHVVSVEELFRQLGEKKPKEYIVDWEQNYSISGSTTVTAYSEQAAEDIVFGTIKELTEGKELDVTGTTATAR